MNNQDRECPEEKTESDPKTYSKPEVVVLGSLEGLTQKVGTVNTDGLAGSIL